MLGDSRPSVETATEKTIARFAAQTSALTETFTG